MIQTISEVVEAKVQYSASALDLATVFCFLAAQEIQSDPKLTQYPVVERRVNGQPAQSASEKVK